MALTAEQQAELDTLNGMMTVPSGAAKSPANKAVLDMANEDVAIAEARTTPGPGPAPVAGPLDQGFQRGADFSGARPQDMANTELTGEDIDEAFLSIPGMPTFTELAQSMNMSAAAGVDFFGPDVVNSVLEIAGSNKRMPTASGAVEEVTGGQQDFMEPGLAQDAVRTGGEYATMALGFGQLMKKFATMVPEWAAATGKKQVAIGATQQLGKNVNPLVDTAMGAASGVGAEYGKEYGGDIGEVAASFAAPVPIAIAAPMVRNALTKGGPQLAKVVAELDQFNVKDAGKILAKQLVRENMSVDDAVAAFKKLGPSGKMSDIGPSFRAVLREAGNQYPRIFGAAGKELGDRAKGQPGRILAAYDDATETSMLDLGSETKRVDDAFRPQVTALYQQAREKSLQLSDKALNMIQTSPTLNKAAIKAQEMIDDARAIGENVADIDYVNNIKLVIDDQINKLVSQGGAEAAKIANLIKMKTPLLKEADLAIPEYGEARSSFASLAELKAAGDIGKNIFKLTDSPADFKVIVDDLTPAQLKLAKLGVKDAIIKKFDDAQATANTIKTMFGKRGALKKAEYLWGNTPEGKAGFQKFSDALETEAQFVMTHREAVGGSTSAKQLTDIVVGQKDQVMSELKAQIADKRKWKAKAFDHMLAIFSKEETPAMADALETAGDILLLGGMKPEEVRTILKTADPFNLQEIFMNANKYAGIPDSAWSVPAVNIGASNLEDKITE